MKHHPYFAELLSGNSTRIAYGARTLNEGGLQSLPTLHFPGGALLGCSAGMVNVPKIKGTHNAMKSGMLAAEAAFSALTSSSATSATSEEIDEDTPSVDMSGYTTAFENSWIHKELKEVRNVRPSFTTSLGLYGGVAYSGLDTLLLKGRTPWTFRNRTGLSDAAHTKPASECKKIEYPPYKEGLSTDLLTSLALTGTNHAEDQPVHLRVVGGLQAPSQGKDVEGSAAPLEEGKDIEASASVPGQESDEARVEHVRRNVGEYAGLLGRACPAGVYEYVDGAADGEKGAWEGHKLVINSQVSEVSNERGRWG
jgi:electron-transferring-flavoprotein dehydrogenase